MNKYVICDINDRQSMIGIIQAKSRASAIKLAGALPEGCQFQYPHDFTILLDTKLLKLGIEKAWIDALPILATQIEASHGGRRQGAGKTRKGTQKRLTLVLSPGAIAYLQAQPTSAGSCVSALVENAAIRTSDRQGFPDSHRWGPVESVNCRGIGNSVPPGLAAAVGRSLLGQPA
jgi:hypothetical protein